MCLYLVDWVLNVVLTYNLRVNYHKVFTEQGTFFWNSLLLKCMQIFTTSYQCNERNIQLNYDNNDDICQSEAVVSIN